MISETKGRNVVIYEMSFKKEEFKEISNFIYEILKKSKDSQIYIEECAVRSLRKSGLLCAQNYSKGSHYGDSDDMFGVERTYDFTNDQSRIFLADNSSDYVQVSYFRKEDMEYTHYVQGIKQVVFIYEEKDI